MNVKPKLKILFYDIESLPNKGFIWNTRDPSGQHMITKDEAIMTIAYKWLGDKKGKVLVTKKPYSDKEILKEFAKVWAKADYVVGHYSDKFDQKYVAYRLLVNGLDPLAPVKAVDTYKMARKHFKFVSNRLDFIGRILGVGRKNPMGWSDWEACANGNAKALEKMAKYNLQDVELLEAVFMKMLPHCSSCPINFNILIGADVHCCPSCGTALVQKRGYILNKTRKLQRYQCMVCAAWSSGPMEDK